MLDNNTMSTETELVSETASNSETPAYTTNIFFVFYYEDGRALQLDKDVKWGELNREGLEAIEVYKIINETENKLIFQMFLEPDKKLIYTRRTQISPGAGRQSFYILGWRKNIGGEDIQSINLIYEDNDIIQNLPRFREQVPFHAPDFSAAEK